ncbi:hypothetical protein GSI01S_29_00050 [Gordonia sihwensis NBRC 108236]|uniref:Uncharacterized protein n=1 Tax=Gordonia sihwensis NBRC 108236 TaxID=1223544 RepID=L7LPQ2_9ACTN|nr:hypothetical protein GSI01S_29_00050 [Gordonia sihwensis NBRC 108236]
MNMIDNRVEWVVRKVTDRGPSTVGALRRMAAAKHRAHIVSAVDRAVTDGRLVRDGARVHIPHSTAPQMERGNAGTLRGAVGESDVEPSPKNVEPRRVECGTRKSVMPTVSDYPCTCVGEKWMPNCRSSAHALTPRPGDYLGGPVTW